MEPSEDPFVTVAELSAELRVVPVTVRRWITAGDLPAVRAGKQYLVRRSDVDAFLLRSAKSA